MTTKELKNFLQSIADAVKIPLFYGEYKTKSNEKPKQKYLIWFFNQSDDFFADGINFQKIRNFTLQLYSNKKEFETEDNIEAALTEGGFGYNRIDSFISEEQTHITTYEMEFIKNEQQS